MCMRILYLVLSFIENPIKLSSLHAIHACNSRLPSLRLIENARPLYFTQCFNSFSDDCKATFSELSHMHGVTGVALAATNNVHICIHRSSASVLPLHLTRDLIAIAFSCDALVFFSRRQPSSCLYRLLPPLYLYVMHLSCLGSD